MRELKFRVWNVTDDCWFKIDWTAPIGILSSKILRVTQYTGIKDHNGKEIYEGDILHCDEEGDGQVIYEEGLCAFAVDYSKGRIRSHRELLMDYKAKYYNGFEVIGNIFENPGLAE